MSEWQAVRRTDDGVQKPYGVLLVCTGNLVRSPAAEILLNQQLAGGPDIRLSSAGTQAVNGAPMAPMMVAILREAGLEDPAFRSRQLSSAMVQDATLILTATRRHRSVVVTMEPAAVRRTFTMLEFARLARLVDPTIGSIASERRRRLTDQIQELAKSRRAPLDPSSDNVEDPYGRSEKQYRICYREVADAVDVIASVLRQTAPGDRSRVRREAS